MALSAEVILDYYRAVCWLRRRGVREGDQEDGTPLPPRELFAPLERLFEQALTPHAQHGTPQDQLYLYVAAVVYTLRGLYEPEECARRMEWPLGMYDYNEKWISVLHDYALAPDADMERMVESVEAALSYYMSFPFVPLEVLDCKACVFCMFESDHSTEAAQSRLDGRICAHLFETHVTRNTSAAAVAAAAYPLSDREDAESERADDRGVPSQDESPRGGVKRAFCPLAPDRKFLDVLLTGSQDGQMAAIHREKRAVVKRFRLEQSRDAGTPAGGGGEDAERREREQDEAMELAMDAVENGGGEEPCTAEQYADLTLAVKSLKLVNLKKKLEFNLKESSKKYADARAELHYFVTAKTVSLFQLSLVRNLRVSLRSRSLLKRHLHELPTVPETLREDFAEQRDSVVHKFRVTLTGSVHEENRPRILDLFYSLAVPFVYKYHEGYSIQTYRVLWFKHMESLGHDCASINDYVSSLNAVNLTALVGQECRTPEPFAHSDPRLFRLYWAAANVTVFCVRNPSVKVFPCDDPRIDPRTFRGKKHERREQYGELYLFNEGLGYKHTSNDRSYGTYVDGWERLFDVLAAYQFFLDSL